MFVMVRRSGSGMNLVSNNESKLWWGVEQPNEKVPSPAPAGAPPQLLILSLVSFLLQPRLLLSQVIIPESPCIGNVFLNTCTYLCFKTQLRIMKT